MLKVAFAIAILGLAFKFVERDILKSKPQPIKDNYYYEARSIDSDGTINMYRTKR